MIQERSEVVILGSGFAGSLLARLLAVQGLEVTLVERDRHPRFAIGESSTPLASLCLSRLAKTYGQEDLAHLASHGRWIANLPNLERGLKRGFTFYGHKPGRVYSNDPENHARLLVAASPNDRVADNHWLRSDVDHHLVREAQSHGVRYLDETEMRTFERRGRLDRLSGRRRSGESVELTAAMVIDATGPRGFLRRVLPIPSALRRMKTRSFLLFSHFESVRLFEDVAKKAGAVMKRGPYPDDWAAVHHVLDEGWMYVLRFDSGLVSAGLLATPGGVQRLELNTGTDPASAWERLLARYPSLRDQFANASPVFPIRYAGRVQHRLARAGGEGWVVLPHTFAFVDPLFSTGIAWGLLAVERLAEMIGRSRGGVPSASALERYSGLLAKESDQIDRLVAGAYAALPDFDLFAAHSMLYFGVVSFAEMRQRLVSGSGWDAFLGAGEEEPEAIYAESLARIRHITRMGRRPPSAAARRGFLSWVESAIASRNVAGLADPGKRNLYPVDLQALLGRGHLLGLTRREVQAALPRLRS